MVIMDDLRVLYDISVLGTACRDNLSRTGVFRVVDNVARGLAGTPGIDLSFCSLEDMLYSKNYMLQDRVLSRVPFTHSEFDLGFEKLKVTSRLHAKNAPPYKRIPLKLCSEALRFASRTMHLFKKPVDAAVVKRFDVFHSPYLPVPDQVKKATTTRRFLTVYDLIPLMRPEYFQFQDDHLLKRVIGSIDPETWVLSISQATKDDLCSYRKDIDPDRVIVTPLAASELFFPNHDPGEQSRVRRKYGIPDTPYILSLSTLEPRKNIDQTVRCFARLIQQERIQDLNLVLVGTKGWDSEKIFAEIISEPAIRDRIIVTGYADDSDLSAIYSGACAFVYPSFYEGFGLPPLEAMQCGVPVITSNTSSLPEVVGDAGIMVSPSDADGLCHAMLTICRDGSLRQSLSVRAVQRSKLFSWESCLAKTIEAYRLSSSS
jgi:glycosyltransferase involved in cell wall biosynthesis